MSDCDVIQFVPNLTPEGGVFYTNWVPIVQCKSAWNNNDYAQLRSICYLEKVTYNYLKQPRTAFKIS